MEFGADELEVTWGFSESTLRHRTTLEVPESELSVPMVVRMIDWILAQHGRLDAPQPVEEPDVTQLLDSVAKRWDRAGSTGLTLSRGESTELIWYANDGVEVLRLLPVQSDGLWKLILTEDHIETIDWSGIDMSQSINDVLDAAAGRPRAPRVTVFVFRDQGDSDPGALCYWLHNMYEELWAMVEAEFGDVRATLSVERTPPV